MEWLPQRKNIRLKNYSYSQNGMYFITICVKDNLGLLSEIAVGEHTVLHRLSSIGIIVEYAINNISTIYHSAVIDKFVIMPNHIHMIISLIIEDGSTLCSPTISQIVKHCKEYVTKQIGYSIWQKSFYDHIIRDENDYLIKWDYIDQNPIKWLEDEYYRV